MRIEASVGRAPKTASTDNELYTLKLTAQTNGERQWLAALLKAIERYDIGNRVVLKAEQPYLVIAEEVHPLKIRG